MKKLIFLCLTVLFGFFVSFLVAEVVLRFLPVRESWERMPVTPENPMYRYTPNRTIYWSYDWNFQLANRFRMNNFGFPNNQDYDPSLQSPLLAIIGDSYVAAFHVPFELSLNGKLAEQARKKGRVYSFGLIGVPMSQYLITAEYTRGLFRPDGMVFVIREPLKTA